jgi:hypothetical protein
MSISCWALGARSNVPLWVSGRRWGNFEIAYIDR